MDTIKADITAILEQIEQINQDVATMRTQIIEIADGVKEIVSSIPVDSTVSEGAL